ncbi:FecR domain-containing protein [Pseudomonas putida]
MSHNDHRAIDEAAQWLALLMSGHASQDEQRAFAAWRDSHPRHAELIARMGGGLAQVPLDTLRPVPRQTVLGTVNTPSTRRRFLGKSLSVVGLGALAWSLGRLYGFIPEAGQLQTSTGERRSLTLDDGSALTLNAQSRVVVRFDSAQRLVLLRCGELLVDVARDPGRPFVVETGHGRMQALGTRFLVQRTDDRTRLVMLHSEVEITTRSGLKRVAKAGDAVSFDEHGYLSVEPASGYDDAWADGLLEVRESTLGDVVEHLRKYRRGIIVVSPQVADLRITGLYFLDDSDRTLKLLERSLPLSIHYYSPYWVSIEPRG